MPKASGQDLKTTRLAPRPQPPSRPIARFEPPSAPAVRPMSQGAPKRADALKSDPTGGIDPRQQHF
jgi:hypothetical protein